MGARGHQGTRPLFDTADLEGAFLAALERHVALEGGGSLAIDETEALTAIDIDGAGLSPAPPTRPGPGPPQPRYAAATSPARSSSTSSATAPTSPPAARPWRKPSRPTRCGRNWPVATWVAWSW
nr:ribonuclease E/G [Oleomonas cavernae]